jgi:membrane protein DedA with SNARE-associated domain
MAAEAHVVFLGLMLGTLVSEDAACVAAGLLIREGHISAVTGVLGCGLGILLGDIGLWALGRTGRRVTRLKAMARWLEKGAAVAIVASRFLPGTRLPLYVAAGALGVPFRTFALWTTIAVAVWTPMLVLFSASVGGLTIAVAALTLMAGSRQALRVRLRRWRRWEFWPMWLFYPPVAAWILLLSVRYRGISTITAANPGIPDGGTIGESKFRILAQLPPDAIIPSALIGPGDSSMRVMHALAVMRQRGWLSPLVLKPDVGQRGVGVRLARTEAELDVYLAAQRGAVLMQPYHPGPFEAGVFYYRFPGSARGRILSITDKHFPFVIGDGRSTLEELILAHPRYQLQANTFLTRVKDSVARVLADGEQLPLAVAGNHAQGTMFRDGWYLWTAALERRIDEIAQAHPGFYVGRFDVRYEDVDAFTAGRGLAIVELNGATAESTDIYDPDRALLSAYRRLFQQWSIVFAVGAANRTAGGAVTPTRRLIELVRAHLTCKPAFELSD